MLHFSSLLTPCLALVVLKAASLAQTTCRSSKLPPHHKSLWQTDFPPTEGESTALCEGTIAIEDDGRICITGRVSYDQIADAVGKPIRAPGSGTISINGHLIAGSGNVILGAETNVLYDYVTSYVVNGTSFEAGPNIVDNLLGASRGTVDGVCLDPSFVAEESYYSISHKFWLPSHTDIDAVREANVLLISKASIVAEYYEDVSKPFLPSLLPAHVPLFLTNSFGKFTSSFLPRVIPVLGALGVIRLGVFGTVSTAKYPQPFVPPDAAIENVQIDTEWSTLISAMEDGLFTSDKVSSSYFGVFIKKVIPAENTNGCWSGPTAAIDIQAPSGWGNKLDEYINDELFPKLMKFGTVGINVGKRLDGGSSILGAALSRYNTACGVQLDLSPVNCYHPICRRTNAISSFTYPSAYYG